MGKLAEVEAQMKAAAQAPRPGQPIMQPPQPIQQPQEPQPINAFGRTFQTQQEMETWVKGEAERWRAEGMENARKEALKQQEQAQQQQAGRQVTGAEMPRYDRLAVINALAEADDPKKWLNPALRSAGQVFGRVDDPIGAMEQAVLLTLGMAQKLQQLEFKSTHQEFPGTPEAWEVLNKIKQERGIQNDDVALELAQAQGKLPTRQQWQQAMLGGLHQTLQQVDQAQQQPQPGLPSGVLPFPTRPMGGIPAGPRPGAATPQMSSEDFMARFSQLSADAQAQMLKDPAVLEQLRRMPAATKVG